MSDAPSSEPAYSSARRVRDSAIISCNEDPRRYAGRLSAVMIPSAKTE